VQPSRDLWVATIGDCLAYAAAGSGVRSDRLGVLGFSLGGHVALRVAKRPSGQPVKAVVSFFAPITMPPFGGIGGDIDKLPSLQIHHGEKDGPQHNQPVSPAESRALETLLIAAGKVRDRDYEIFFYEGQGHGFTGQAASTSEQRTVDFFVKRLA
jgi:dienelactone hydrolase